MVSSSMETQPNRKRRWRSSSQQSARGELDFGQKLHSPKKRRIDENHRTPENGENGESFTINSFYGKREKIHFPHSPGRRKKVGNVLDKLSSDSEQSDSNKNKRRSEEKSLSSAKAGDTDFEFHSSDPANSVPVSKGKINNKSKKSNSNTKKTPLNVIVKKTKNSRKLKTQTENKKNDLNASTDSNMVKRTALNEIGTPVQTPTSGKKFFKTRSPAAADKCFGSIVVHKGFNLQFKAKKTDKKASATKRKDEKRTAKPKINKTSTITTSSSKLLRSSDNGVIYVEDDKAGADSHGLPLVKQSAELNGEHQHEDINSNETVKDTSDLKIELNGEHQRDLKIELNGEHQHEDINSDETVKDTSDLKIENGEHQHENINSDETVKDTSDLKIEEEITRDFADSAIDTANSEDLFSTLSGGGENGMKEEPQQVDSVQRTPSKRTRSISASPLSDSSSIVKGSPAGQSSGEKLFPIFKQTNQGNETPKNSSNSLRKLRSRSSPGGSPLLRYVRSKDKKEQMIIDAGQKRFGVTQCDICGMVYTLADPADETMHMKFHQGLLNALKFPGWKKEHVIQEYLDTGGRIILIQAGDPSHCTKKVEEINNIMGRELGFPEQSMTFFPKYKAFLYISSEKRIDGCCITQQISEGYPVIPSSQPHTQSPQKLRGHRPWYCSDVPQKAVVGISKIWVYSQSRKKGIATRLLDCVRQWSVYGSVIPKKKLAFSDPTPDGKKLAENYTGLANFLVYKFQ